MIFQHSSEAFLRSYLDNAKLIDHDSVFVIGTFDQKKTVATQQQRASVIALAAIKEQKKAVPRAAIIGGGFAGLTCAAALLKLGCKVSLFEQKDRFIPIQVNCSDRYLHPSLYDWPNYSPDEIFKMAGISWQPGYAYDVAQQVIDSLSAISDTLPNDYFDPHLGIRIEKINQEADKTISLTSERAFEFSDYDMVFVAIGFGLEKPNQMGHVIRNYWQNSAMSFLNGRKYKPERVLVSGTGDGGLISVLNCALRFYDHSTLHEDIEKILDPKIISLIAQVESSLQDDVRRGAKIRIIERYDKELLDKLGDVKSRMVDLVSYETEVTFNSPVKGVFTPSSSAINRILVYLLLRAELISFRSERLESNMMTNADVGDDGNIKHVVNWRNEAIRYDHIITRHGIAPDHFNSTFSDIKNADPVGLLRRRSISLEDAIPDEIRRFLQEL